MDREDDKVEEQLPLPEDEDANCSVLVPESFDVKMSRALFLCKEWFGKGSLAQLWVPVKNGEKRTLSASDKHFFLYDDTLSGYRRASESLSFDVEPSVSSLPGRVLASKIPEWTSKVSYYNHDEFSRMHLAVQHKVSGSLALPVFEDDAQTSSCAVLEVVTTQDSPSVDVQIDAICNTLQGVELRSRRPPRLNSKRLSLHQNAALGEIKGILYAISQAQQLPLALTWIPCEYQDTSAICEVDVRGRNGNYDPNQKLILCIDELSSYWQDEHMQGFIHACKTHPLGPGQGLVGKSVLSNHPLFHPDVKKFHISEYPLVHHARMFGLSAAIAIRLRSDYTGLDDYVVEFFLPGKENKTDKIMSIAEAIYKSLMKGPNVHVVVDRANYVPAAVSKRSSSEQSAVNNEEEKASGNVFRLNLSTVQLDEKEAAERAKKRSTIERSISLSDLQQIFTGNTKHAAGFDQNSMKRACRKNRIPRWASRRMKMLNRSFSDIQNVLEAADGLDGAGDPS